MLKRNEEYVTIGNGDKTIPLATKGEWANMNRKQRRTLTAKAKRELKRNAYTK